MEIIYKIFFVFAHFLPVATEKNPQWCFYNFIKEVKNCKEID